MHSSLIELSKQNNVLHLAQDILLARSKSFNEPISISMHN